MVGRDDEERQPHEHHVADGEDHLVGTDVEEPLELVDVVVEDGHQPADRAVLEVGELELLDVPVGLHAHVVLDVLGEVPPRAIGDVVGDRLGDPHHDGDHGEDEQLGRTGPRRRTRDR